MIIMTNSVRLICYSSELSFLETKLMRLINLVTVSEGTSKSTGWRRAVDAICRVLMKILTKGKKDTKFYVNTP